MELTINQIDVIKLDLKPDEVLFVKVKIEDTTEFAIEQLGEHFRKLFPKNKVAILTMGVDEDIELTTVKDSSTVEKDCSDPAQYCSDCSCGKKERLQGE